jgi:hypothetical protein
MYCVTLLLEKTWTATRAPRQAGSSRARSRCIAISSGSSGLASISRATNQSAILASAPQVPTATQKPEFPPFWHAHYSSPIRVEDRDRETTNPGCWMIAEFCCRPLLANAALDHCACTNSGVTTWPATN